MKLDPKKKQELMKLLDKATNEEIYEVLVDFMKVKPLHLSLVAHLPKDEWRKLIKEYIGFAADGEIKKGRALFAEANRKGYSIREAMHDRN